MRSIQEKFEKSVFEIDLVAIEMVESRNFLLLCGSILLLNVGKYSCAPAPQDVEETVDEGSGEEPITNFPKDIIPKTCLSERTSPYTYFSTKTTYLHPDIGNMNTDIIQLPRKIKF